MSHAIRILETPLGRYVLAARAEGLSHVQPEGSASLPRRHPVAPAGPAALRHLESAATALRDYFDGRSRSFAGLDLAPEGTPFQQEVWQALREIPFGQTASYGEIARRVGREGAARAVGGANHDNPLGIVVPCHRVVGADGHLTGYAGGLERKRWLLRHEGALPA
jgi:methylated-DNA-[protein]-cysteine S-methyltransferase